jgi:hypothetical protein
VSSANRLKPPSKVLSHSTRVSRKASEVSPTVTEPRGNGRPRSTTVGSSAHTAARTSSTAAVVTSAKSKPLIDSAKPNPKSKVNHGRVANSRNAAAQSATR